MTLRKLLYKVTMRRLGLTPSDRVPFIKYIVLNREAATDKDVVAALKRNHHTLDWWAEVLITDIEYLGEIWYHE